MAASERKILFLDSDRAGPHPEGICPEALKMRDELLRIEDVEHGKTYQGRCSRRKGVIKGCLIELIPTEYQKKDE
ncbi:hypothetical protein A2Z23_02985 [Candidatus Curtissbacteria bacterium RBG_16_39_7]|uniref:Uncharacterized protein n=1 Tax=Candidatus Curtissbacteria bacterium RBG_16_39_7 TaxID=1797707 RepID=A0A1F5G223_9BACT|nr:MAG: hypothetical protein A2Z23_02985 [Candidatus Curtissbacteria bacterium RBG_16_39_7]